jgi:hypothetical protein
MIRRALNVGVLAGLLLSLSGLYPALSLYLPVMLPEWGGRPINSEVINGLLLMLSAGVGIPTLFVASIFAVHRAQAWGWKKGFKVGALTGGVAGLFVYITLMAPLNALLAFDNIATFRPSFDMILPPPTTFTRFLVTFENSLYLLEFTLGGGVLLFGLIGLLAGRHWRTRSMPPKLTLFSLSMTNKTRHEWFADNEDTIRTGLLVGVLVGAAVFMTFISHTYIAFAAGWPELTALLQSSEVGFVTGSVGEVLPILWPLLSLGLMGLGGFIVIFSRNPADRFRCRIRGTVLAMHTTFLFLYAVGLRDLFLHLGLFPYYLVHLMRDDPATAAQIPPEIWVMVQPVFFTAKPQGLITAVLASPWIFLIATIIMGWVFGAMQGLFYGAAIPWFYKQPVDKAAVLLRRLQRNAHEVLPIIYAMFKDMGQAYDVLAHLAAYSQRNFPDQSHLMAAYHTLGTTHSSADVLITVKTVREILHQHPEWQWSADFEAVYGSANEVLQARTLDHLLLIKPPPTQQTSSLPPIVVKSLDRMSRILTELHKVEKVDDLPTKLIFLENSLAVIHQSQQFIKREFQRPDSSQAVFPAHAALIAALDNAEEVVLTAVTRLKGRADIISTLQSKTPTYSSPLPLVFQINNRGLNVAQQLRLKLLSGSDYRVTGSEHAIEILPPGEERQVTLMVMPHYGTRRLRVEWEIVYDDAVDADRRMTFADVAEFTERDKPFQRIFPIPYVTGTPLKTDDVFVGRSDVFTFIRENLLGVHQNNVIILHGQRRTGKTSVLYRLGQMMRDTHYGVLIDMQGKPARGEVDFLYSIADDIVFTLEDHGVVVDLPARSEFEEAPEFYFRSRFLRGLQPHLNGKNLLLLFDEFEELQRRVEDGRLSPDIFQFLRNLMQHEKYVDFVFSGTHKLEDLGAEYWSVLFNIAAYKPITFLSYNEIRQLILEPIKESNLEYDSLAIDRIMDVTAGHPYFSQLVLHEMIVYHNETERNYITVTDVNHALEQIVERGEAHFKYIWSESSAVERLVLQAMSELLVGKEGVSLNDVCACLEQRGHQKAPILPQAFVTLTGRDILMRKGQLYSFKVDLIRLWIERTRPSL